MARYTGPVCRICRRENNALFLKGRRCFTDKCAMKRRAQIPGMHGKSRMNKKPTEYSIQLREKQKVRRIYGVLEAQFRVYYARAARQTGNTGVNFLRLLESRLDNTLFRLGFGMSRSQSRMWVTQGHFAVNGKKVSIPSYQVQPGDVVGVGEKSPLKKQLKDIIDQTSSRDRAAWLELDAENLKGKFLTLPERAQLDPSIQESLIVENYSR
jgi:small subunit ribosomal protein S4